MDSKQRIILGKCILFNIFFELLKMEIILYEEINWPKLYQAIIYYFR